MCCIPFADAKARSTLPKSSDEDEDADDVSLDDLEDEDACYDEDTDNLVVTLKSVETVRELWQQVCTLPLSPSLSHGCVSGI